jgi:hypothetical protein
MQNNYTICFINMQVLFAYLCIKFLNEYTLNIIIIGNGMHKYKLPYTTLFFAYFYIFFNTMHIIIMSSTMRNLLIL